MRLQGCLDDSSESLEATEMGNAFQTMAAACTTAGSVLNKSVAAR